MHLQQHQPGQRKDQTGGGEDVQEPAPGQAGVAAFVQIVQVRDPAAVGGSYSTSPLARSMDSQASPPARGSDR
jgi:hypothetical protein